jgi:serine/threonine protein phosphatase PrpC
LLNKQLLLDVAQLTDVGRRREHNEDNMAYVIPKDPQVMERKGALFIVADGMGGHAAGEVASEIAVDTISTSYYPDEHEDVAEALLSSIKRTNTLIHQRAAENMLRSGMGTTSVVGVMRGNMGYVANVGDSRAYLVRRNKIKQISQDHSWVAEQVRAGLLTEDQARTHAQRNVITRSLGTQPDVEVDVFAEPLEAGDRLLLCSDGLSGVVSDEEMCAIIERFPPQESVYHLIERANENGGPDNITAIVISVLEVGVEPPGARHPVVAGRISISSADTSENTAILSLPPYVPASSAAAFGDVPAGANLGRFPSGPLPLPESPLADRASRPKRHARLLYIAVAACFLLLLFALIGGGAYVYLTQNSGGTSVSHEIDGAQRLINKAQGETPNNPTAALRDLATAQTQLTTLANSSALTSQQHSRVLSLLRGAFTQSVQNAIVTYNQQQNMIAVDCLNPTSKPVSVGTTSTQPASLALATLNGKTSLYALGANNLLYLVSGPSQSLIDEHISATIENVVGYNGSQLAMIVSQPSKTGAIPSYSLDIYSSSQNKIVSSIPLSLHNEQAPTLLASWGQDIYIVVITAGSTQITIDDFSPAKTGNHQLQMTSTLVSVSSAPGSIAAFPNKQLFLLLQDGTVQSLQLGSSNAGATSVFVNQAVPQPLPVSSHAFNWQTQVPTAPTTGSKALAITNASANALVSAMVGNVPHLYIMDSNLHRILDLTIAPTSGSSASPAPTATATGTVGGGTNAGNGVGSVLHLQQQYESPGLLAQMRSLVVDTRGAKFDVLVANTNSSFNLVSFPPGGKPQAGCS